MIAMKRWHLAHLAAWFTAGLALFATSNVLFYVLDVRFIDSSWLRASLLESLRGFLALLAGELLIVAMAHVTAGLSALFFLNRVPNLPCYWYMIVPLVSLDIWAFMFGVLVDLDPEGSTQGHPLRIAIAHSLFTPLHLLLYGPPTVIWGYVYWHIAKRSDADQKQPGRNQPLSQVTGYPSETGRK
jgi:hypothetical protein